MAPNQLLAGQPRFIRLPQLPWAWITPIIMITSIQTHTDWRRPTRCVVTFPRPRGIDLSTAGYHRRRTIPKPEKISARPATGGQISITPACELRRSGFASSVSVLAYHLLVAAPAPTIALFRFSGLPAVMDPRKVPHCGAANRSPELVSQPHWGKTLPAPRDTLKTAGRMATQNCRGTTLTASARGSARPGAAYLSRVPDVDR